MISYNSTYSYNNCIIIIDRPPADVLQNDVRIVIANDKDTASHFINSSLNYLNWTFSEFISLFQEVLIYLCVQFYCL